MTVYKILFDYKYFTFRNTGCRIYLKFYIKTDKYQTIDPFTVTEYCSFGGPNDILSSLVKYEVSQLFQLPSFNCLPTETSAKLINLACSVAKCGNAL